MERLLLKVMVVCEVLNGMQFEIYLNGISLSEREWVTRHFTATKVSLFIMPCYEIVTVPTPQGDEKKMGPNT